MRGSEVILLSVFFDHILQAREQTGKTIPELLAEVKKAGISAVEINSTYLLEHPETLEMLEAAGLQVSCVYEFYALERGRETEKARRHIEIARKAKAGKILIVPGFFSVETEDFVKCVSDKQKVWDYLFHSKKALRMADGLREIVEMAEKITVVIEDFDDRNSPIACVNGMLWFAEQVPGLHFTFDTGNFIIHGEDIFAAWEALKDKTVHVHCKDRKRKNNMTQNAKEPDMTGQVQNAGEPDTTGQVKYAKEPDIKAWYLPSAVGEGCIPIRRLVHKMREDGYQGYFAIEHFDAKDQERCMQASAASLRTYGEKVSYGKIYTK